MHTKELDYILEEPLINNGSGKYDLPFSGPFDDYPGEDYIAFHAGAAVLL